MSSGIELPAHYAGSTIVLDEVHLADKDVPVLASAVALECDTLVTGDRTHFGALWRTDVRGVRIVSPVVFAHLI